MSPRVTPLALFVALAALVACGGDSPVTPPQRLSATVQLKARDVLVFAGQRVSLRSLVLRVTDANGTPITDYQLGAELPAGWVFRNDTMIAPANEAVARLKVTATYAASASSASHAALFSTAGAADSADTATVTSGVDLKARKWRVSFTCADSVRPSGGFMHDNNVFIDSMRIENAVVDSVLYASDSSWIPQFGGVAQLWYSGTMTRWLRDGTVVTKPFIDQHVIQRQAPDSLITEQGSTGKKAMVRVTPGTLNQVLRYEGGTFCASEWRKQRGPVAMQEVAP